MFNQKNTTWQVSIFNIEKPLTTKISQFEIRHNYIFHQPIDFQSRRMINNDLIIVLGETDMKKIFSRLMKDESGATAIEYGLIAALISVAIIGGASLVGTNLEALFQKIGTTVSEKTPA
jgi:pilus assembly protein Flp/PilA